MLRLFNDAPKTWGVYLSDLKSHGMRSPRGFSMEFSLSDQSKDYWWTTDFTTAYLFYEKYGKATEYVREEFDEHSRFRKYLYELSYATDTSAEFKAPEGLEYRSYQKAGIEYCLLTGNTLIADQMRLGKTIITLGVINNLPNINKVLIVCPKTAKAVWEAEATKWLMGDYKIQVVTSQTDVDPDANIYIVNYDILHIKTALVKQTYDVLIGDEVHLAKNADARRAKFFFGIQASRKIGLTGTPLLNKLPDLLTLLRWLDSYWSKFFVYNDKLVSQCGISFTLEELQDMIRSSMMLRRVQAQVFGNEPIEKRIIPLPVTDEVEPLIKREMSKLTDYTQVRRKLGLNKVQHALRHIEAYSSDEEKMVVFAYHHDVINRLQASLGAKCCVIYGDSTERDRKEAVHKFNTDKNCSVLVGSIPAASMALNLSVASHILFTEFDWTPGLMEQAEERCSDLSQKRQVVIEYMVYPDSLDHKMLQNREVKEKRSDAAIDLIY